MLWGISSPYAVGRYAFARARGVGGSSASSAYRSQPKCSATRHGPTSNSALKVLTCHEALILNKNHLQNNPNPNQDDRRSCRWVQWSKAATRWADVLRCEGFGSQFALRECGHLEKMSLGRSERLGIIWLLCTSLLAIYLRFVNPAAEGLFIFFCCWRGMAGQAQVLPCSPATCFSHGWWGEADSSFDKRKWAEGYRGIPRVSTAQTDV